MKHIVAVNASPRVGWNTDILVREAAQGAESEGAEVKVFDLYKLERFTGCISCFGCKLPAQKGQCVYQDGLAEVLEQIRTADGLILGTPNYLGDVTAGFRALYERLIFQNITYQKEQNSYNNRKIPVLLIMTSNASEELYKDLGYAQTITGYQNTLNWMIGPTKVLIYGDTLQVRDYSKYDWSMFDPDTKMQRHETVLPQKKREAFMLGAELITNLQR